MDDAPVLLAQLAPCGVAGEDGVLPVGGAADADFEVGGHVADGGEQFVVDVLDVGEVAVAGGVGE